MIEKNERKSLVSIFEDWKREIGGVDFLLKENVAIHIENGVLFIITRCPGYFIGLHGRMIEKYQKIMKESGYDLKIQFVELGLHYVAEF